MKKIKTVQREADQAQPYINNSDKNFRESDIES